MFEAGTLKREVDLLRAGELGDLAFGVGPFPAATLLPPVMAETGVRLQVSNTGPLVARANVSRDSSSRSNAPPTSAPPDDEGLGLGLSIVAAVAHAHDATLTASAQPKGGLDIVVRFPRRGAQTGSDPHRDGAQHATGAAAAITHRPSPSTVS